ncbi:MAG: AEC family transporter [Acholeplasmataceae bacterium]|nr:AEC family transporter [Acholeplasmataceae bacterium]
MDTFVFALNAILPLVILVVLGSLLKKSGFIDDLFVNRLYAYVFRIGLPALLFYNVYQIGSLGEINWLIVLFVIAMILFFFVIGLISVIITIPDQRRRGVVLQAVFRANFALIGVPLATGLGGDEALRIMSLVTAFVIPLSNILSVIALSIFSRDENENRISMHALIRSIITNPLILAVVFGLIVVFLRPFVPVVDGQMVFSISKTIPFVLTAIKWIAQTATPLALIALGGQFKLTVIKELYPEIIQGVMWKNVLVPALSLFLAWLLIDRMPGIRTSFPALVAIFSAPVAVSSVVMTAEIGGDERLAGQIVVWSTFMSMFSVFVFVATFRALGVL